MSPEALRTYLGMIDHNPRMEFTKQFARSAFERALESWRWLDLQGKDPLFTSLFGDVFFASSDGIWFLDAISGALSRPWENHSGMESVLATDQGKDQFLMNELALAAHAQGLVLKPNEVYNFVPPPVLGGKLDPGHMVTMDFVVALNIAGQIHGQIKDLAPGTRISGITVDGAPPGDV